MPGAQTLPYVSQLVAQQKLTAYQAVLLSTGLAELLRIGEYEVLDRLGRGGMAIVLRVRHGVTGHQFVLKLLEAVGPVDSPSTLRFLREMEAVCGLAHPNIAVARCVGRQANRLYIVLELVDGCNMAQWVMQHGPLPATQAIHYIMQAADGRAHAHQRGLVHRDVKPGNLMLGSDNRIKLVDMGLARFVDLLEGSDANGKDFPTRAGYLAGTIDFMAPEQADNFSLSDRRSDIYSLGCTLFFLLAGQSHLSGQSQRSRALALISRRGISTLREVHSRLPESIYDLAQGMMRLDPAERFQTMDEVIEALQRCGRQLGVAASETVRCRVLMVEDSTTQAMLIRQTLAAASQMVEVEAVTTLAEAISSLQRGAIDIVLLDLNLPGSGGVDTVDRLRQLGASVPIIVMTNSDSAALGVRCLAAGADDFLPSGKLSRRCCSVTSC